MVPEITVHDLQVMLAENANIKVLDVRRQDEYDTFHITDLHLPFEQLEARVQELDPKEKWIIYCHGGGRSGRAVKLLQTHGFEQVYNLKGGISTWLEEIHAKQV